MIENRPVVIIGAGGHARVLISTLKALRREIVGVLHPDETMIGQSIDGIPVIGNDDKIREYVPDAVELVNGIGSVSSTKKRHNIYKAFKKDGYSFATIVHPAAIIADNVKRGDGAQIMADAVLQTGCSIGCNAIINIGAIIDHDCIIGDHVHISPGAVLSGGVKIGAATHVGAGATIIQGIEIGESSIIGAGAVVIRDVPAGKKVIGSPAKTIT